MPDIEVRPEDDETYRVVVSDDRGSSSHLVRLDEDEMMQLGGGASATDLIAESFRFLLEREPKESILSSFRLPDIARYFPEYPQEIRFRLEGTVG